MHLTESQLAALTHRDVSLLPESVATHLESCPDCAAQLRAMRADDKEVATLLGALDHQVPRLRGTTFLDLRRRRRRIGVIAAGLAFLAAGAAAALPNSPLHHVLVRVFSKPVSTQAPAAPVSNTVSPAATAGIAFLPAASLDVRFISPQPGGRLRLRLVEGSRVSATADGDAAFSIHQSQLDVADHGAQMTFTLEIPRTASEVTVHAGNEIIFEKRGGAVTSSQLVDSAGVYKFTFRSASSGREPPAR